ncbi:MAG: glycosyltransferase [Arenicellales bacterium]|nr:glycosyltransferase [Arenicellales bacterium]
MKYALVEMDQTQYFQRVMKVSVVIPTFNREKLLCRALDSVVAQSLQPFEIIVVDDGSTDSTQTIVKNGYKEVVYIFQPNRGVSSARNKGIKFASGDWLSFLDSDDEWLPTKLAKQAQALSKEPKHRICHTNEIWIRRDRRVNPMRKHEKSGGWIYKRCLPLCVISPSSVLVHRMVFESIGYFDEELPACEDYDFWLRMCAFYPVLYLSEPLIKKYGGHDDQLSKKYWGMDRFRIKAMEKMLEGGLLGNSDRLETIDVLLDKLHLVLAGAYKRNNTNIVEQYRKKIDRYEQLGIRLGRNA